MAGFAGKENHSVDAKGRLMIPAKFRKKLAAETQTLFAMKMPEGSIELYEKSGWEEKEKTLSQLSDLIQEQRILKMMTYESLEEVDIDGQNRIGLSKEFQSHCGLTQNENEVTIIGAGNKLIIWKPARLNEILSRRAQDYETLTQRHFG
jgi:MraZ protein